MTTLPQQSMKTIDRDALVSCRLDVKHLRLALADRALGAEPYGGGWRYHDDRVAELSMHAGKFFRHLQDAVAPLHHHRSTLLSEIAEALPLTLCAFEQALSSSTGPGQPLHARLFRKQLKTAIDALRVLAGEWATDSKLSARQHEQGKPVLDSPAKP